MRKRIVTGWSKLRTEGHKSSAIGASTREMSNGPSLHLPDIAFRATIVWRRLVNSLWEIVCTMGGGGNGGDISIVGAAKANSKFNVSRFVPRAVFNRKLTKL